jgi:hypothetical protein
MRQQGIWFLDDDKQAPIVRKQCGVIWAFSPVIASRALLDPPS